ncbi:MAG: hypothetical protein AAB424_03145 [Patescibacteria group bacterium]
MKVQYLILSLLALPFAVHAQTMDVDDAQTKPFVASVQPPEDMRTWTPEAKQFRFYVNVKRDGDKVTPQVDILGDNGSWPFVMKHIGDTVYVYIVPPGYKVLERSVLEKLPNTFSLVAWAGTERAIYMFSFENGKVTLDIPQSAPFISVVDVKPLPENVLCWQLAGSGNSAGEVQRILKALGSSAKLIQLKKGFYQGEWFFLKEVTVRNLKMNETDAGTLLALELADPSTRDTIRKQLQQLARGK